MFQIRSWPTAILHLDGDAFFASVMQAINPQLKGKPVIVGKDRGIATAISYEAKKYGVKRGMRMSEIKSRCPDCIFMQSDYDAYSLFSKRMFQIVRSYIPVVEEYSVDEAFADIKGFRRPLHMSYMQIGKTIKDSIEKSLGITVSVGISLTKSLAKLASGLRKPSGLTVVDGPGIERLLKEIPTIDIWGIGENTASYLRSFNIHTALDFTQQSEMFIKKHLSKPFFEIWRELRGEKVYELNIDGKTTYKSISKTGTFAPATNDPDILWAKLLFHIEEAFTKARSFRYRVGKVILFLKTQTFSYHTSEIKLLEKTAFPLLIRKELKEHFVKAYRKNAIYRATGCIISDLEETTCTQQTLFSSFHSSMEGKVRKIYPLYENKKVDFGTALFDKQQIDKKKEDKKFSLPVLSLVLH